MRLLPKRPEADPSIADPSSPRQSQQPAAAAIATSGNNQPGHGATASGPKGRPTPKRRDRAGQRGPAAPPPRNRKEAYRWQKEQSAKARVGGQQMSRQAHREALRRGDPSALPRREQGPVKALARDYVDSRRMFSNYLLIAFLLIFLASILPVLQYLTLVVLAVTVSEWYLAGKRIKRLAVDRGLAVRESAIGLGFYAGSRAYLPRRWRIPAPQKALGDII